MQERMHVAYHVMYSNENVHAAPLLDAGGDSKLAIDIVQQSYNCAFFQCSVVLVVSCNPHSSPQH